MQRNHIEKNKPINSTTEIYKTLSIQNNAFNISPPADTNNLLKIIILLSLLNSVEAQENKGDEMAIAIGIGATVMLGLTLILCALTKGKLFDCCESSNSLSDSINYNNSDLEEAIENTQSTYTLPSYII